MKYRIEVTAEDIKKGEPGNICQCPIALATKRILADRVLDVEIGGNHVGFVEESDYLIVPLPQSAQDFISRFDGDRTVQPFSFEIEISEATP